jgi:MFS family permease
MSKATRDAVTDLEGPIIPTDKDQAYLDSNEKRASVAPQIPVYNDVELVDHTDLSFGSILKGTAARPLTLFEKKAALINGEMDKFGLGRYQWCIWFLCGFGYFLDLAWAQGVGLIATAVYQEMGVPDGDTGHIWSLANAGLAVGALTFGILVDVIGRRWAFNLTCLITSVFGLLLAAPKYNYGALCGIYFLASLGLGGNIPIDATIALEFLPQKRRNLVTLLSMWQPIGVVVASAVAYGTAARWRCAPKLPSCHAVAKGQPCCTVSSNMGWRYEVIVLGCMTLAVFFLRYFVFHFHESPKFLISRGRDAEAIEVLHRIAKFNRAPPPTLTLEDFRSLEDASSEVVTTDAKEMNKNVLKAFFGAFKHLKGLFINKVQGFAFIVLAIAYMGDYWSFNLAGSFLPIILLRHNVDSGADSVSSTYQQYLIIYSPGIIGAILGLFSVQLPLIGRKWSLVLSAALQGVSMAMYTQVYTTPGYVGLNAFEYVMQTVS